MHLILETWRHISWYFGWTICNFKIYIQLSNLVLPVEFVSHMLVVLLFICSEYKVLHKVGLFDSLLMIFDKFNLIPYWWYLISSTSCLSAWVCKHFLLCELHLSNCICWETSMHFSLFRNLHPSSIIDFPKLTILWFSILENRYRLTFCIAFGGCHSILHNSSLRLIMTKLRL